MHFGVFRKAFYYVSLTRGVSRALSDGEMTSCFESAPASTIKTNDAVASASTLTLIDRKDRILKVVFPVADRKSALALYREIGEGYDAHVSGPIYDELILALDSAGPKNLPAGWSS